MVFILKVLGMCVKESSEKVIFLMFLLTLHHWRSGADPSARETPPENFVLMCSLSHQIFRF